MQTSLFLQLLFAYFAAAQVQAPDEGLTPETVQNGVVVYPTATLSTGSPATSVLPGSPSEHAALPGPSGGDEPVAMLPPAPEPQPHPTGPAEIPGPVGPGPVETPGPVGPGPLVPTAPGPGPSLPTGPGGPGVPPSGGPVPVPTGPPSHPGPSGPPSHGPPGPSGPPPGVTGPGTGYPPIPPGATPTGHPAGPPPPYLSGGDHAVSAKLGSGALVALIMCAVAMM
ncbi:hypothetical protein EV426DRAFT_704712 [Tirmania nivea]|nr:hypothetical protein EV426DRAFT_704712 [Tirmania nivea]